MTVPASSRSVAVARGERRPRVPALLAAGIVGAVAVGAALVAHKQLPEDAAPTAAMRVDKDSVTLDKAAPQWKAIRLGKVTTPGERWSDAFPARFRVDESVASRVGSPLSGRVTSVSVELGQSVKAGAPLFAVASPDIASLRADQAKAAVDLQVARAAYDRVKAMVAANALPTKDELESDQQEKQAELALKLAQMKLASLKVSTRGDNEFTVVAPRDGVIIEKTVLPGQQVQTDDSLVSVAELDQVWVMADLFEADATGIDAGSKARVTSPSLPGFSVEAPVERVSSVVDPDRHTVAVRVKLPNPELRMRPNMFAEVRFLTTPTPGTVEMAASAVVSDGPKQYAYVLEAPGRFVKRSIVAGSERDGRVTVLSGLKPEETVVEQGAALLDNQIDLST
ncbi:MAG TPA: efflux RND transporter periplasmic adaptor subunit [Polyangiaceae bacterium]|nr:efflux RND transporter periplasmic adaptor subunit [Polyangiaceae bacterium]